MRIAGIGCRPGTPLPALLAALEAAGGADALATIPERAPELRPLAHARDLPLHLVAVAGIATPTQSVRILAAFDTGSVAEAAAIAASLDGGGRLTHPRRTFGPVTIAIAEVP
ncbi:MULTISPECIES: cobalamin biosynthesis protein [Paracoccus]|uniref:cobalamin biosynthesis protein n=1 Tax=Paracoccus TaxID=265 RepID=UPI0013E2F818|nr:MULTISPECIES: cobalamin biosynthesis protein [Paracoccus]